MISTMDKLKMIERHLDYETRTLNKGVTDGRVGRDFADYTIRVWKAIYEDYVRILQRGGWVEEKDEATRG